MSQGICVRDKVVLKILHPLSVQLLGQTIVFCGSPRAREVLQAQMPGGSVTAGSNACLESNV